MSVSVRHLFNAKHCLDHAEWYGAVLYCPVCQRALALRFRFGKEVRVYVYPRYQKFRSEIEGRKDTGEITSERDFLGEVDFTDWEDFLHDFKSRENTVLPVREGREWVSEDCEGPKSDELQSSSRSDGGTEGDEETKEEITTMNIDTE